MKPLWIFLVVMAAAVFAETVTLKAWGMARPHVNQHLCMQSVDHFTTPEGKDRRAKTCGRLFEAAVSKHSLG
jgi:hypothetical protein